MLTPTPLRANRASTSAVSAKPPIQCSGTTHSTGNPQLCLTDSDISLAVARAIARVTPSKDSRTPPYRPSIAGLIPTLGRGVRRRLWNCRADIPASILAGSLEVTGRQAALQKILLVVLLRRIERRSRSDFGDDRAGEPRLGSRARGSGDRLLLGRVEEHRRAILRSKVGSLPILLGRVVNRPEHI